MSTDNAKASFALVPVSVPGSTARTTTRNSEGIYGDRQTKLELVGKGQAFISKHRVGI